MKASFKQEAIGKLQTKIKNKQNCRPNKNMKNVINLINTRTTAHVEQTCIQYYFFYSKIDCGLIDLGYLAYVILSLCYRIIYNIKHIQ